MARIARIGTTAFGYLKGMSECHEKAIALVTSAGNSQCDLVLLPELFLRESNGLSSLDHDEAARMQADLQALAARYDMYIIAGLPVWEGDDLYNGGVVIDRTGKIAGIYKKIHPTEGEVERGFIPATDTMTFDMDFGRVGVLICYDIGWPDEWRKLREQGAELVCWLSAYDGGFPLQSYAWTHKYYVVSSVLSTEAMFADMTGGIIGKASRWGQLAIEEINLDRHIFHASQNWDKLAAVQEHYGAAVRIRSITEQNVLTLEPTDDSIDIKEVIAECGLEPYVERIARNTKIQNNARAKHQATHMAAVHA